MTIRENLNSQEFDVDELLADTPKADESSDERVHRKTRESFMASIMAGIDKQFDAQLRVAREIGAALAEIRKDENGRTVARVLKEIHEEVQAMRNASHINEATLFTLEEVRDVNQEIRAELQGIGRGIDETNRLLGVLTDLLSNGHATH